MPEPLPLPIVQPEEILRAILLALQTDEYLSNFVGTWQAFQPEEDVSSGLAPWAEASLPGVRVYPTTGKSVAGWFAAPHISEVRLPIAIETAVPFPDVISSIRLWERIELVLSDGRLDSTLRALGVRDVEVTVPGYGLRKFDDAAPSFLPGDGEVVVTFHRSFRSA